MIRILALDPGSEECGGAVLHHDQGRTRYVQGFHGDFAKVGLHATADWNGDCDALILELIEGYAFNAARVADMVKTARHEGIILGIAQAANMKPMTTTASEARGLLCRAKNASDAQVAIVVEALVAGAPKHLRKVDRQHIYDACLYGLVGLMRLGARFKLPPAAEAALHIQREKERAAASAKGKATKAARQMGAFR